MVKKTYCSCREHWLDFHSQLFIYIIFFFLLLAFWNFRSKSWDFNVVCFQYSGQVICVYFDLDICPTNEFNPTTFRVETFLW